MRADVIALPVHCGGIMNLKEEFQYPAIIGYGRVKGDFNGFGMAAFAAADVFICWIWCRTTGIAHLSIQNAGLATD